MPRTLEEKLTAIATHFALGPIMDFERTGGTNDNYLVSTPSGGYLFKMIVNSPLQEVLDGLPFLQRLQEYQFTASAYYLSAPDGSQFYHSPDCDAVVLTRLPGSMPQPSQVVSRAIGAQLARLHLIPGQNLPAKPHWLDASYLTRCLQSAVQLYGPDRLQQTLRIVHSLSDFRPETFPQSIVHGDLDTTNCLFDGDRLVAFVDWQEIGVGAAIMDFAMTVLGFCFVDAPEGSDLWACFDPELFQALFSGYQSVRLFSDYELAHLDAAFTHTGLTQPLWTMLNWEQYHPGEKMVETNLLYWKYGLPDIRLSSLI
ncbi:phosphotransferase [Dictyobacter aurantiacus]|uniref:Homoserine kinase n=1 Tax=Dictyobacter aurantiacus TaxID=1936993 RepID=A0A401ZST8_9CHLR|nr:phosphotransferase [Dictyobacter aurantiacus]GCE09856.1 homoserine kinase [Dictyobacter aurantiacus]